MVDDKPSNATDPDLKDVEPGSDADALPTPPVGKAPADPNRRPTPAPLETGPDNQNDDNIDDKGHKSGGGTVEQPT